MENISYIGMKVQCMQIMTKTSHKREEKLRIHKRGGGTCGQWLFFPTHYSSPFDQQEDIAQNDALGRRKWERREIIIG
jgi:hypothetical protein